MPIFKLKVGKQTIEVQHTAEQSFEDFQAKVFTLTDIPPKNLKLLVKSKMIKDNKSLMQLSEDAQLLVMGTKCGQQLKNTGNIKIENIMLEQAKLPQKYGLTNIGNTCYMNAAIQFLRSIPEFHKLVGTTQISNQGSMPEAITGQLRNVLKEIQKKDVVPKSFVGVFLVANPEFTPFGEQFDSDQFMQKLLNNISSCSADHAKTLKNLFELEIIETTQNVEIPEQQPKVDIIDTMKFCCSLGGVEKDIKVGTIMEGIKLSLEGNLQKISPLDNQNHLYHKSSRFNKLPKYLLIQMVRFFWKQAGQMHGAKATATKICKSIDFAKTLDVFNYCTPDLQKQLQKGREALQANEKKQEEEYKKQYEEYKNSLGDTTRPETRIIQEFKQKWKKKQIHLEEGLETGMYEMRAIVTHLGHSIESGHYMTWVKESEDEWMKYDDDSVYPQPEAKVMQLRGGQPNLQIAYVILFRKVFTKPL